MHIFGGRRRLIFVVIIVTFAVKVFGAFVFMGRTKVLISSEGLSHIT
jgi:hypothetical protein